MTFLLVFLGLLPLSAFADSSQSQIWTDEAGNIFEMKVAVPTGKTIDNRIFPSNGMEAVEIQTEKPLDVSGYKIELKLVKTAPSSCQLWSKLYKPIPIQLAAGTELTVTCDFCESMTVAAFPTVGNVNVGVRDRDSWCQRSKRPKNRFDSAGCYYPGCVNTSQILTAVIENPYNEPATFVSVVDIFFGPN